MATTTSAHRCPDIGNEVLSVGDPTRVRIVHALSLNELCTSDLASVVAMSESAVSHQLRTLRQLHVVKSRREGKLVFYSLNDDHVRSLFQQGFEHAFEDKVR